MTGSRLPTNQVMQLVDLVYAVYEKRLWHSRASNRQFRRQAQTVRAALCQVTITNLPYTTRWCDLAYPAVETSTSTCGAQFLSCSSSRPQSALWVIFDEVDYCWKPQGQPSRPGSATRPNALPRGRYTPADALRADLWHLSPPWYRYYCYFVGSIVPNMRRLSLNAAPVDNKDEGKLAELGYKQVCRVHMTSNVSYIDITFPGTETRLVCPAQLRRLFLHHFCGHRHHYAVPVWPHHRRSRSHVHWMDMCELLHTVRWFRHGRDHECYPNGGRTLLLGGDAGTEPEASRVLFVDHGVVQLCRTV